MRTNGTPDERGSRKGRNLRARKVTLCKWRTNIINIREHPILNGGDNKSSKDRRKDLSHEHCTRWDLHIMADLQIARERDTLCHGNKRESLEKHNGNRAVREQITSDDLREDVDRNKLVRHRTNDANGDNETQSHDDGEDECPDWEISVEDLDGGDTESEGDEAEGEVPPVRNLGVRRHEAGVDVSLVTDTATELTDDIMTVPD